MNDTLQSEADYEMRALVECIKRGDCVLVLGPGIAIRDDDATRTPLDEILARQLLDCMPGAAEGRVPKLRHAAEIFFHKKKNRGVLELKVGDFFRGTAGLTTAFHCDLAALPFRLCVSASLDDLMFTAFKAAGKTPQKGYYSFRRGMTPPPLAVPTEQTPLVYSLFGHFDQPSSIVLTEGDLIEFLVAVVKGAPAIPDQVRHMLADKAAAFLFLGFGFQNWYLRVLLQVLDVYGHQNSALAFEDAQFFEHPEREQTLGFFSDENNRLIEFRQLHWDVFAKRLHEIYEASAPQAAAASIPVDAPKVFVSYASEDRRAVDALAERLLARGVAVWQDDKNLRAGDNWENVLSGVIEQVVDYAVVVQTPAMVSRVEGIFNNEIAAAKKRQTSMGECGGNQLKFLIPVKIGECPLLSSLSYAHVIDVGVPEGVDALVQSIQEDWQRRAALKSRSVAV